MPQGFAGAPYRSTDSTVYVCVEGQGRTVVGEQTLAWGPRDIFVVPSCWMMSSYSVFRTARCSKSSVFGARSEAWRSRRHPAPGVPARSA
jgi:gentisate 1,2-dioxygenase